MTDILNDHANVTVLAVAVFFAAVQIVWWPLTCRLRVHTTRLATWWHGIAR